MARERISLVPEEEKIELTLEARIRSGEINPDNFSELPPEEQKMVNNFLFKIASEKVEPNQGTSALEFILFGFIRIMTKKVQGLSLTREEKEMEEQLNDILSLHQMTNTQVSKKDWLFDYLGYAHEKAAEILKNREEHINRKKNITGRV